MNWIIRISESTSAIKRQILKEFRLSGWTEDQLNSDGMSIWKNENNIFFSIGDWSKISGEEAKKIIQYKFKKYIIDWDYEVGSPGGKNWIKIL